MPRCSARNVSSATTFEEFVDLHRGALETNEARHNLPLGILGAVAAHNAVNLRTWTLGAPGQCAIQSPGWPIVLGELDRAQCRALADGVREIDYPGVVGPEATAEWFAARAEELGATFGEPIPQMIQALTGPPRYPGSPGRARPCDLDDAPILLEWVTAFHAEAVPNDPPVDPERVKQAAGSGRYTLWLVDETPVSMAAIMRRTRNGAAISAVYTPPALRGRGYAGSVVAATVERAYAEGKTMACLYTDLRNPFSNRCYAKIGFKPVCASWHYPRTRSSR